MDSDDEMQSDLVDAGRGGDARASISRPTCSQRTHASTPTKGDEVAVLLFAHDGVRNMRVWTAWLKYVPKTVKVWVFVFLRDDVYPAGMLVHPDVERIPFSRQTGWGDVRTVDAHIECFAHILKKRPKVKHIVNITGTDIPTCHPRELFAMSRTETVMQLIQGDRKRPAGTPEDFVAHKAQSIIAAEHACGVVRFCKDKHVVRERMRGCAEGLRYEKGGPVRPEMIRPEEWMKGTMVSMLGYEIRDSETSTTLNPPTANAVSPIFWKRMAQKSYPLGVEGKRVLVPFAGPDGFLAAYATALFCRKVEFEDDDQQELIEVLRETKCTS